MANFHLEEILNERFPVLDHGFIRVVDYMGGEAASVQAARVSYGSGTKSTREDDALNRYLMRHSHTSPFEMSEIKFHVKMPIFVARQWVRHRTASLNEYSGRYSVIEPEFYVPEAENLAPQSTSNKQGRSGEYPAGEAEAIRATIRESSKRSFEVYRALLDETNLARELARTVLPLNTYTEWYWKIDVHNLFHFLRLRMHPNAQYEIRAYAEAIARIVQRWMPNIWTAFEDYRLNAVTLSGPEIAAIRLAGGLDGIESVLENFKDTFSSREADELLTKVKEILHG